MPIYRSPSNRLSEYDYSQADIYFVTICIDRLIFGTDCEIFGKVIEDDVMLNDLGLFVEQQIKTTETIRPYVEIISYIVMHDHVHMVIQIHEHDLGRRDAMLASINNIGHEHREHENGYREYGHEHRVPTADKPINKFGPQSHNLASIIRGFKSMITSFAKKNNIQFKRQSNYYEHVVRNSNDLEKILQYIETNPIRRTEKQSNALP